MAWKITKDHLEHNGQYSAIGIRSCGREIDPARELVTFNLYDDDGEHYYTGVCDDEHDEDIEGHGSLYEAWRWGEGFAGCTDLRLKGQSIYA